MQKWVHRVSILPKFTDYFQAIIYYGTQVQFNTSKQATHISDQKSQCFYHLW